MQKFAIIVAGGSGSRMENSVPKQFIEVNGKPVLMHTLNVFEKFDSEINLILVLPKNQVDYWSDLCQQHNFRLNII
ncbi:MAG: 2-C-methyl-D-erythritol 4-phosphate cytidylyltransferase [Draconibacterium sp.]|nr:2-C-methyl-D-erythritol 4-phosphate cytidylyltransferase [Draconibacterium sp.]